MENNIKHFPKEIINKMVERQVQQGNKPDVNVFRYNLAASRSEGGFDWSESPETDVFWSEVIEFRNIDAFYDLYPDNEYSKDEYPKIMMVSNVPITEENKGYKRVVFMKKLDKYLAWSDAETIEEAEKTTIVCEWKYAEDYNNTITLTHEEIAAKLNIDPSKLKIIQ